MGFFSIKDMVRKLLSLIDGGLEGTAGREAHATFCVQQAVSLATGEPGADDQPKHCVMPWIVNLGISLNDANGWTDDSGRAAGLREFAVAELGSNTLREKSFRRILLERYRAKWPDRDVDDMSAPSDFVELCDENSEDDLIALAKMVVDILREMNSPGTEYLFMASKKYDKPEDLPEDFGPVPRIKPATEEQRRAAWVGDETPWELSSRNK